MEEQTMIGTIKQVEEWSTKATKYDELVQKHTRCVEAIRVANAKVVELSSFIEAILHDIEPAKDKKAIKKPIKKSNLPKINVGEKVDAQIKKLNEGGAVTIDSIKKDNPELDTQRLTYIFYQRLCYLPNIQKHKEIVNGKSVMTLTLAKTPAPVTTL